MKRDYAMTQILRMMDEHAITLDDIRANIQKRELMRQLGVDSKTAAELLTAERQSLIEEYGEDGYDPDDILECALTKFEMVTDDMPHMKNWGPDDILTTQAQLRDVVYYRLSQCGTLVEYWGKCMDVLAKNSLLFNMDYIISQDFNKRGAYMRFAYETIEKAFESKLL